MINKIVPKVPKKSGNTKQISPSKNWCFTFNNYSENDILDILKVVPKHKYVFQEEIGENGTPHLQGTIFFSSKVRPKNLFNKKIHWEKVRNKKNSIAYCSDIDKRPKNGRIWSNIPVPEKLKIISVLNRWQKLIYSFVLGVPDDRLIYWVYDKVGGKGKTKFAKYLCYNHDAIVLSGKCTDMKYGIMQYIEKKGVAPKIVILDIPRQGGKISYKGIEEIKNGLFFNTKYESNMVMYNPPHLLVLSNSLPEWNLMSVDRWFVFYI